MPFMVNGFGTWNWGKEDTLVVWDACPECNKVGPLTSYDTRRYITALFLPIIPLDRRRIQLAHELAQQTFENFDIYAKTSDLEAALLIGGTSMRDQEKALESDIDVLIATPGRLLDLVERGQILMRGIKYLVIDEADRMLDMGFIPDVERIVGFLPPLRQTLMF